MNSAEAIAFVALAFLLAKVLGPIGAAIGARLRPTRHVVDMETLAEVDALKTRLAEVEERLDFAERLLARADAAEQLPGRVQR